MTAINLKELSKKELRELRDSQLIIKVNAAPYLKSLKNIRPENWDKIKIWEKWEGDEGLARKIINKDIEPIGVTGNFKFSFSPKALTILQEIDASTNWGLQYAGTSFLSDYKKVLKMTPGDKVIGSWDEITNDFKYGKIFDKNGHLYNKNSLEFLKAALGDEETLRISYKSGILIEGEEFFRDKITSDIWVDISESEENNNNSEEIKNIILIGATGQGKSSLANTLVNKENNFEEIFGVSEGSISHTKDYKTTIFEEDGITYRVIDTIGIGDTGLSEQETLIKLSQAAYELENGLSRVIFVINKRVDEKALQVLELLSQVLFDKDIVKHTTVVKTGFTNFKNKSKCESDLKDLKNPEQAGSKIIKAIGEKNVVYVDNPPFQNISSNLTEEDLEEAELVNKLAESTRKKCRKILLDYLKDNSEIYKPTNLQELNKRIREHTSEIEVKIREIKKQIEDFKKTEGKSQEVEKLNNELANLEEEKMNKIREEAEKFERTKLQVVFSKIERGLIPLFGTDIIDLASKIHSSIPVLEPVVKTAEFFQEIAQKIFK